MSGIPCKDLSFLAFLSVSLDGCRSCDLQRRRKRKDEIFETYLWGSLERGIFLLWIRDEETGFKGSMDYAKEEEEEEEERENREIVKRQEWAAIARNVRGEGAHGSSHQ